MASRSAGVPEDVDAVVASPAGQSAVDQLRLPGAYRVDADGLLELEHQARTDRLDDGRCARLLAVLDVVDVDALGRADVLHRAAARHDRYPVAHQVAADGEDAGRPGPTDELVRAQEHRVLAQRARSVRIGRIHADVEVGAGGGVVPEGERAVPVEQLGDGVDVGQDSGDVARRGEGADAQRPAAVPDQL
jgi:hypothetical protein